MQVYTYWHRGRSLLLIPANSKKEADRIVLKIKHSSLSPVQSNLHEAPKQ